MYHNLYDWRVAFALIFAIMLAVRLGYDLHQGGRLALRERVRGHGFPALVAAGVGVPQLLLGYEVLPMSLYPAAETSVRVIGLVLIIASATFFISARVVRRESWAAPCEPPRPGNRDFLCTWGPYAYVRHPFYGSIVMSAVGFELMAVSWLVLIVAPVFTGWYLLVAHKEEHVLRAAYGREHLSYVERVPRCLVPYLI